MPYVRKSSKPRSSSARPYRKRAPTHKSSALNKKITTIAKNVVMRQAETKSVFSDLGATPIALYHNTPKLLNPENLLRTLQGTQDAYSSGSFQARIGDSVQPRGIKIYLTFKQSIDKPNVNYRLIIQKARDTSAVPILPFKEITGVKVVDALDSEHQQGRSIMQKRFADRSMSWSRHDNTTTHNSELTFVKTFWVPLSGKYQYSSDNGYDGRDFNLNAWLVAYDSFGTLTSDIAAQVRFAYQFYFKDI